MARLKCTAIWRGDPQYATGSQCGRPAVSATESGPRCRGCLDRGDYKGDDTPLPVDEETEVKARDLSEVRKTYMARYSADANDGALERALLGCAVDAYELGTDAGRIGERYRVTQAIRNSMESAERIIRRNKEDERYARAQFREAKGNLATSAAIAEVIRGILREIEGNK